MVQEPLATCAYGWGRTLKLYQEYLDIDGTLYALHELMRMHARYRRVMNISSVRLELQFRQRSVTLRGICANDAAEQVVTHLKHYCPNATIIALPTKEQKKQARHERHEHTTNVDAQSVQEAQREQGEQEHMDSKQALSPETPQWLLQLAQDLQRMQTRKTERISSQHGRGKEDGADPNREQLAQHLQADTLPSLTIPIPLRLAPGEQIRYSIDATLCTELLSDGSETPNYTYPPKDQGMLMLTNRRLLYMGRRGQRVLGYARILRVSRLRGAIALLTDVTDSSHHNGIGGIHDMHGISETSHVHANQRTQREIFQMSRPMECALYLDHLLRQFYMQAATRHLGPEATPIPRINNVGDAHMAETTKEQVMPFEGSQLQQQWSLSTRATEKVQATHLSRENGVTEGIDKHSIQRSLCDVADVETRPLATVGERIEYGRRR